MAADLATPSLEFRLGGAVFRGPPVRIRLLENWIAARLESKLKPLSSECCPLEKVLARQLSYGSGSG